MTHGMQQLVVSAVKLLQNKLPEPIRLLWKLATDQIVGLCSVYVMVAHLWERKRLFIHTHTCVHTSMTVVHNLS